MSKETELSDEQIEKIAKTYIRSVGGYSCSEDAIPDNGKIEDFARAIIAADRELRRGDVGMEPFGYFKAEPFGWTDCAETDEGAIALYDAPQPQQIAEPASEPVAWTLNGSLIVREDWAEKLKHFGEFVGMGRAIPDAWMPVLFAATKEPS